MPVMDIPVNWITQARLVYLSHLATEDADAIAWGRTLREYFEGQHPVYLDARQKEFIGLKARDTNYPYAHNLCHLVVAAVVERLHVTGFAPADSAGDSALADLAAEWWDANRMDAKQDEIHEAACVDAESFVIVEWPEGAEYPRWHVNYRYDGEKGVKINRDPATGEVLFASKRWMEYDPLRPGATGQNARMTIYHPNVIERYISRPGSRQTIKVNGIEHVINWEQFGTPWPLWWTDTGEPDGEPIGMAVISWLNPGGSEIEDILSIQDALNKGDLDLLAAQDVAGFRILWASGVQPKIDSTGEEVAITLKPATVFRLSDPAARLNAIEPSDLDKMIRASKYWIESLAGVSRTPQYLFEALGADQPSGESLRQREVGLLSKVERKQRVFGNAWEDLIYTSARLWNRHMPGRRVEITPLQTQWAEAGVSNEREQLEMALMKSQLGIPDDEIFAELGYDREQIDRFVAEKKRRQEEQANIGERMLRQFETGRDE